MKKYIYQVTAIVKANCTEYKYVVDVDADNQKEAVQTAKGMWDKVHHLFHVKARRLEAHEEALYAFWTRYEGEPQTKSKPEEAHVDIDEMTRAPAPETEPAETETAPENVSETATEADATEQATAKVYAVSFIVDGIAQANMAIAESAEAAKAYYNREYSGCGEVCAVREAAEWEIAENRRRGMPFVTVPTEAVSEPETETNATVKAAIARLTRRVKRETGDNIRDCFEAIAEGHDAASEAIAAMEKEADDYINAVTARFCADGTEVEVEPETADNNATAAMTAQEVTARKMIHEQTTTYLLDTWESTTTNNDPCIPTVRGWLMDELQSRYPEAYDKWLDSETCEDAALRKYINAAIQAEQAATEAADIAEAVKKFTFLVRKHNEMMNNAHIASLERESAAEMDYLKSADRLYKAIRNAEARLRNAGADVKVTDGDYPYYHITGVTVNGCAVYPEAAPEETPDAQEPEAVTETAPAPEFDYDFLDCRYVLFEHVCGSFSNEYETDKLKEARDRLKEEWDGSLESGDWGLFDRDARQYIRIRATAKGRKAFMAENARLAMKAAPRSEFVLERLYSQAKRDGELERLHYAEIGGGYSDTPHVEIWTEKVVSNFFVTTIYNHTLVYSTLKYADTPEQAERDFTEARGKYLQPLQKAKVENARLAAKAAPQEPDATPEPVSDAEGATDGVETETVELHDDIDTYAVCEKNGITWTRVNADTLAIRADDYRRLLDGAVNKQYIRNLRRDSNTGRFCGGAFTLAGTIAG